MNGSELVDYLRKNDLLVQGILIHPSRVDSATLVQLCDAGMLRGGLSIASDVRPDEAIGSLCISIGGSAMRLRVLDVLQPPHAKMVISLNDREDEWELRDIPQLVKDLNRLFGEDDEAKAIGLLGEWEDSWQLWCLPKFLLPKLLAAGLVDHDQLRGLVF